MKLTKAGLTLLEGLEGRGVASFARHLSAPPATMERLVRPLQLNEGTLGGQSSSRLELPGYSTMTYFETHAFHRQHRCFREALVFFAHYSSTTALLQLPIREDEIRLAGAPETTHYTALLGIPEIFDFLKGGREPETLRFAEGEAFPGLLGDDFGTPAVDDAPRYPLPPSGAGYVTSLFLLGNAWERSSDPMQKLLPHDKGTKFIRPKVAEWPEDLAFYFHLRNACFHRGRFNIRENHWPAQPTPGNPARWARWRDHVIDDPVAFKDRAIFGPEGLLTVAEVLPLLFDIGNAIDRHLGPLPPS